MSDGSPGALFEPDGALFVPTELARGPWDPTALHGGPASALLARGIEHAGAAGAGDDERSMTVARLTVELLRPVPLEPLALEAAVVRGGRKVQLVEATLRHAASGTEVARARALRIRQTELALPSEAAASRADPAPVGPDQSRREVTRLEDDVVAFHNTGAEHRFAAGTWAEPGPVTVWIRLRASVVPDEAPSPLQRVMAAADFGNGVSRVLSWEDYLFINPDLTVHLLRPAIGEWICLDARTFIGPSGTGLAESALYDEQGRIGRSAQSLLVDRRA